MHKPRVNFSFESAFEFKERFWLAANKLEALCLFLGQLLTLQRRGGALSVN